MCDETPDTGDTTLGGLIFGALIGVAVGAFGGYALSERLRRKETEETKEMER